MATQDRARHEAEATHLRRLAGLAVGPPPAAPESTNPDTQSPEPDTSDNAVTEPQAAAKVELVPIFRGPGVKCGLCERTIPRQEWSQHLSDPSHARKARLDNAM